MPKCQIDGLSCLRCPYCKEGLCDFPYRGTKRDD